MPSRSSKYVQGDHTRCVEHTEDQSSKLSARRGRRIREQQMRRQEDGDRKRQLEEEVIAGRQKVGQRKSIHRGDRGQGHRCDAEQKLSGKRHQKDQQVDVRRIELGRRDLRSPRDAGGAGEQQRQRGDGQRKRRRVEDVDASSIFVPPDQFLGREADGDQQKLKIEPVWLEPEEQVRAEDNWKRSKAKREGISSRPRQQRIERVRKDQLPGDERRRVGPPDASTSPNTRGCSNARRPGCNAASEETPRPRACVGCVERARALQRSTPDRKAPAPQKDQRSTWWCDTLGMKLSAISASVNASGSARGRTDGVATTGSRRDREDGRPTDAASLREEDIRNRVKEPGVPTGWSSISLGPTSTSRISSCSTGGFDETAAFFRGAARSAGGLGASHPGANAESGSLSSRPSEFHRSPEDVRVLRAGLRR